MQYLTTIARRIQREEEAFSTAELLGNAALGILALVVIWAAMQALGMDIINWIRSAVLQG